MKDHAGGGGGGILRVLLRVGLKGKEERVHPSWLPLSPALRLPKENLALMTWTIPMGESQVQGQKGEDPANGQRTGNTGHRVITLPPAPHGRVVPEKDSEAGTLVTQPPQICQPLAPAIHLPAGTLGQSPSPRPATASAAAAAATATAATGAAAAAPVLVDGDLDLGCWLRSCEHPAVNWERGYRPSKRPVTEARYAQ